MSESKESDIISAVISQVRARDPDQPLFLEAVSEVVQSLGPVFGTMDKGQQCQDRQCYKDLMLRCVEPERVIMFRVPWVDDNGKKHVNRGYRVQFNSAIGPYKGGLRFHPTVNLDTLKFLAFEQMFKNALTPLPMGAGKGGSDFNPRGKSDQEVMNFCQSFMCELYRHIGQFCDVPAGDIGVGGREIGYLFGQYKRLQNQWSGVLTGKHISFGGSLIRTEATGYGLAYFTQYALKDSKYKCGLETLKVALSGSGNVAQYAAEKLLMLGAKVITMSDSGGYIYEPEGITRDGLDYIFNLKQVKRGRIKEYAENYSDTAQYFEGRRPWEQKCDLALPCATQNEIEEDDAKTLAENDCKGVFEGANMPSTSEAIAIYHSNNMMYGPGKACNAGGVAVSGLEMTQDSTRLFWEKEEVDAKLTDIMKEIYESVRAAAVKYGDKDSSYPHLDLQLGANVAGFLKVASAMQLQGWV